LRWWRAAPRAEEVGEGDLFFFVCFVGWLCRLPLFAYLDGRRFDGNGAIGGVDVGAFGRGRRVFGAPDFVAF